MGDAIRLDNEGNYKDALEKYMSGIQRIIHVIKCTWRAPVAAHSTPFCFRGSVQHKC